MDKMNELSERRKERRFFVHHGAFAVSTPFSLLLGQIIDISTEGLSFHYIADEISIAKSSAVSIYLKGKGFQLKEIPVKVISDIAATDSLASMAREMKRCSVQYKELSPEQKSQLEFFISHYSEPAVS